MLSDTLSIPTQCFSISVCRIRHVYASLHIYEYQHSDFFLQFDAHTRCFLFDVEQDIELSNPEPAYVKIYDYYETGQWKTMKILEVYIY